MKYLNSLRFAYCRGCGHNSVAVNTARALENSGFDSLDVITVSDIGCCGLIDRYLTCHTVHGLHGRACALASGIRIGLQNKEQKNKVILAFQGDGGATIGLAHILEAARRNINITLIVQNNMVYGMTGGQCSGLSPVCIREKAIKGECNSRPYNLVKLAHDAGATYSRRITGIGNYSEYIQEALSADGFSLLEIMEVCPSYGMSTSNDLKELEYHSDKKLEEEWPPFRLRKEKTQPLFHLIPKEDCRTVESTSQRSGGACTDIGQKERWSAVIFGSAGEGVQSATGLMARSALECGLWASKKGSYPITVGSGFSIGELIISKKEILYDEISLPDIVIIASIDGLNAFSRRFPWKYSGHMIIERSVWEENKSSFPDIINKIQVLVKNFRKSSGAKGAALSSLVLWAVGNSVLSEEAIISCASESKYPDKMIISIQNALAELELPIHP